MGQKGITQLLLIFIILVGIVVGVYGVQYARTVLRPKASEETTIPQNNIIYIVNDSGDIITNVNDTHVKLKINLPPRWELPESQDTVIVSDNSDLKCPVNFACCENKLRTCGQNSDCTTEDFKWCYNGYCIRDNYNEATDSCPKLALSQQKRVTKFITITNRLPDKTFDPAQILDEDISITSDFNNLFSNLTDWNLKELASGDTKADRVVTVIFRSEAGFIEYYSAQISVINNKKPVEIAKSAAPSFKAYIPNTVKTPVNPGETIEYNVDFIIDQSFPNPEQVFSKLQKDLDDVNTKLAEAKIARRLKVGKKVTQDLGSCEYVSNIIMPIQPYNNILIFVPSHYSKNWVGGWAANNIGAICIAGYNDQGTKVVMLHEIGHIFGLPDYNYELITSGHPFSLNEVNPHITIIPRIRDFMAYEGFGNQASIDPISAEMINRTGKQRIVNPQDHYRSFTPKQVSLKIVDQGKPVGNVKVEVFPSVVKFNKLNSMGWQSQILNKVSFEATSNGNGEVELGGVDDIFTHRKVSYDSHDIFLGKSALFRLTYNEEEYYSSLTVSDLVVRYFSNDDLDKTQFTLDLSVLPKKPNKDIILRTQSSDESDVSEELQLSEDELNQAQGHLYQQLIIEKELEK